MERRYRLSRSRDFDAVYRHGRSTSTRYLTLHAFPREEPEGPSRLGLAIPKSVGNAVTRNRLRRQLREVWTMKERPGGLDCVLSARPGLAEATEAQGISWLSDRVDEVLGKAGV